MNNTQGFFDWAVQNWARAALPVGVLLLLLSPFIKKGVSPEAFFAFLLLPIYMIHQYEEHAHGEFKAFVTGVVGGGREVLTDTAIFWINVLAVWVLGLIVVYLTVFVRGEFGLFAGYLTAFNGLLHGAAGVVLRRYNPGILTSLLFFLPLGIYSIYVATMSTGAGIAWHGAAVLVALLTHGLIMAKVRIRISRMSGANPSKIAKRYDS
jgi:hypothetical protein